MKIKETDLMWQYYKRWFKYDNYKGEHEVPHPKSICNYFWKSIGGMMLFVFWDSINVYLFPVIAYLVGWNPVGFFLGVFSGIAITARFVKNPRISKYSDYIGFTLLCIFLFLFLGLFPGALLAAIFYNHKEVNDVSLYEFAMGCLTWFSSIGAFVVVTYLLLSESSVAKTTRLYAKSFKDRICPMVEAPWDNNNVKEDKLLPHPAMGAFPPIKSEGNNNE